MMDEIDQNFRCLSESCGTKYDESELMLRKWAPQCYDKIEVVDVNEVFVEMGRGNIIMRGNKKIQVQISKESCNVSVVCWN